MDTDIRAILSAIPRGEEAARLPHQELVQVLDSVVSIALQLARQVEILQEENRSLREQVRVLTEQVKTLQEQNYALLRRLNTNSGNSGIPSSKDPPWYTDNQGNAGTQTGDGGSSPATMGGTENKENDTESGTSREKAPKDSRDDPKAPGKNTGARKGHPGARQRFVTPDEELKFFPGPCSCGCQEIENLEPCYKHQYFEIPTILVKVLHIILYRGTCSNCGKVCKGEAPRKFQAGYGPNLSALVQGLITLGLSRRGVLEFLRDKGFVRTSHGEGLQISHGGLNRIPGRVSSALKAHYEKIGEIARTVPINHVDETGWRMFGPAGKIKVWLWVMVSCLVTFFMIHTRRSKEGFQELVGNWSGILTSDDYAVYSSWPAELRQSCLAHLSRAAKKLSQDPVAEIAKGGLRLYRELCRLTKIDREALTEGEWRALMMRVKGLINLFKKRDDCLGTLARRLEKDGVSLYTFLRIAGVEATNNIAERALRAIVVKRKNALGSISEAGFRWLERSFSFKQTCRQQGWPYFEMLRGCISNHLQGLPQDLSIYEPVMQVAQQMRKELGFEDSVQATSSSELPKTA